MKFIFFDFEKECPVKYFFSFFESSGMLYEPGAGVSFSIAKRTLS